MSLYVHPYVDYLFPSYPHPIIIPHPIPILISILIILVILLHMSLLLLSRSPLSDLKAIALCSSQLSHASFLCGLTSLTHLPYPYPYPYHSLCIPTTTILPYHLYQYNDTPHVVIRSPSYECSVDKVQWEGKHIMIMQWLAYVFNVGRKNGERRVGCIWERDMQ